MFSRSEKFILALLATVLLLIATLSFVRSVPVDWRMYDFALAFDLVFLIIGLLMRISFKRVSGGSAFIAAGLLLMCAQLLAVFNYLLLPYGFARIDAALVAIDERFGFVWSSFVIGMAKYPQFCDALKIVYQSTMPQIAILVFALGLTGRTGGLSRLLIAIPVGALVSISTSVLLPSATPAAFQTIPADIAARLSLVVDAQYGAKLVSLGLNGVPIVSPIDMQGLVGFPSYHTVMAVLVVWYARGLKPVFPLVALWNLFMLPAVLLHGAHNLTDVFGGLAVTAFCIWFANHVVSQESTGHRSVSAAAAPVTA